ncbi:MAG: hypothetical protein IPK82_17605 [Polyangiaceae bacterium]|nr:hypothetical protein [Polyangiaceae bacterium]
MVIGNCAPTCDGAAVEPGEDCDGADLGGFSCQDFGYDDPTGLACVDCQPDSSGCLSSCDGNALEPGEECDGADLNGKSCLDYGYASPAGLGCTQNCTLSSAACTASCGNGVVEPGESCDGSAPVGATCTNGCVLKYTTVINETVYNPVGSDGTSNACFIELYGPAGLDLTGYSLKFINGLGGTEYVPALKLDGQTIGTAGYFVVVQSDAQLAALPAGVNGLKSSKADMQQGPDSVVLVKGADTVDALGYGIFMAGDVFAGEGAAAPDAKDVPQSVCRLPNGKDTDNNAADFALCTPTPGASNLP